MFRNVDSSLQEGSLCCLGRFTTRKLEISRFNSFIKSPLYPRITALKFSIKDFFSKCDQICSKLRIWSHLLKKFLMENFVFCVVYRKTARYFFLVIQRFSCITQHIKEHSTFLKSNNLRYKKKKKIVKFQQKSIQVDSGVFISNPIFRLSTQLLIVIHNFNHQVA